MHWASDAGRMQPTAYWVLEKLVALALGCALTA
jgi:hypothetical protein